MRKTTILALLTSVIMTGGAFAADRPQVDTDNLVERPQRPERPTVERPVIERPEVAANSTADARQKVRNTRAELDRIKEALKRLRENNRDLTDEQIQRIKARLLERARALIARARGNTKERIDSLKPRLGNRDQLLEMAREKRDQRQTEAKASTAKTRE